MDFQQPNEDAVIYREIIKTAKEVAALITASARDHRLLACLLHFAVLREIHGMDREGEQYLEIVTQRRSGHYKKRAGVKSLQARPEPEQARDSKSKVP